MEKSPYYHDVEECALAFYNTHFERYGMDEGEFGGRSAAPDFLEWSADRLDPILDEFFESRTLEDCIDILRSTSRLILTEGDLFWDDELKLCAFKTVKEDVLLVLQAMLDEKAEMEE